jgi:hypothetical protein
MKIWFLHYTDSMNDPLTVNINLIRAYKDSISLFA